MLTAESCVTSIEGWALFIYRIANLLSFFDDPPVNHKIWSEQRKRKKLVEDAKARLSGGLWMIVWRVRSFGHENTANDMLLVIHIVSRKQVDVTEVRRVIHEACWRISGQKAFKTLLANL